jgi:hypothetical protein
MAEHSRHGGAFKHAIKGEQRNQTGSSSLPHRVTVDTIVLPINETIGNIGQRHSGRAREVPQSNSSMYIPFK